MQVTDEMVLVALAAYNKVLDDLSTQSCGAAVSIDDIREVGLRAALTASLAAKDAEIEGIKAQRDADNKRLKIQRDNALLDMEDFMNRAEQAERALAEAVEEQDRLRDDIRHLWNYGTDDIRICEHCDAWMTIEEAARVEDVSLCPREAYGSVKFPDEKCFKHRAWIVKEERESTRAFVQQHEGKK